MKRPMLSLILTSLLAAASFALPRAAEEHASATPPYAVIGIVREISPDRRKALIQHEAIANYMPAMTMEFNVRNTNELSGVHVGDGVAFRLKVENDAHWIEMIHKRASATNHPSLAPTKLPSGQIVELKPGDVLPDFELLAENGKPIRFSDFRGKVVAFTFFFTRCPLPDYCPRMSKSFARAREIILAAKNAPTNWQFLSISFDPDFDKPGVLASYASSYRKGNLANWVFAAAPAAVLFEIGPRLDLMVTRDPVGGISHNLRTVVLDPEGRIFRQFDGNEWTPERLAEAVMEAAGRP